MAYTAEQLRTIRTIRQVARKRYANDPAKRRRYEMAAYTIGRVEANFTNPRGGDADSVGWRQERASIYGGDMNIRSSVNRVFNEMEQHDRGQGIGELAADVQRPAAQYRSRYAQHLAEAKKLAGGGRTTTERPSVGGRPTGGRRPRLVPGGETTDTRGAMLAALRDKRKGMGLLDRYQEAKATGDFTTTTSPKVVPGKPPTAGKLPRLQVQAQGKQGGPVKINELFWNGPGAVNVDNGKRVGKGFVSGHTDHVHFAADRASMKRAAALAARLGLRVGEYGKGITSGHAAGSFHYRPYGAMDVSGDVKKMAAFARRVAQGDF